VGISASILECRIPSTDSVGSWLESLATNLKASGSIAGATTFSE
jgi:hypothetical protein